MSTDPRTTRNFVAHAARAVVAFERGNRTALEDFALDSLATARYRALDTHEKDQQFAADRREKPQDTMPVSDFLSGIAKRG